MNSLSRNISTLSRHMYTLSRHIYTLSRHFESIKIHFKTPVQDGIWYIMTHEETFKTHFKAIKTHSHPIKTLRIYQDTLQDTRSRHFTRDFKTCIIKSRRLRQYQDTPKQYQDEPSLRKISAISSNNCKSRV